MRGYAHVLASKRNCTLYVGVTSDLPRRGWKLDRIEKTISPGKT